MIHGRVARIPHQKYPVLCSIFINYTFLPFFSFDLNAAKIPILYIT